MKVSDELIELSGMNEQSLRQELALWLYSKGKLSIGRAMKFAKMNRFEFMELMNKNNIPMNYSVEDLEQDIQTIKKLHL
jgi:predicted HTH domain antitoxin